ncbi:MAG: hypothetical protein IJ767_04445 [Bacteroidaceae bacterium]|nr:hypothetical protein [Bacteroidaceae bacterium]
MKTIHIRQSHTWQFLLLAICTFQFSFVTSMQAQESMEDAFYIYRNDGGFNGFLFSEVERMEFSKVDTAGVTQYDYVV